MSHKCATSTREGLWVLAVISFAMSAPVFSQNDAPQHSWFIAPQFFLAYYDNSFGYEASHGAGFRIGRECRNNWWLGAGGTYHLTVQPVVLLEDAQELKNAWYRASVALQKQWWFDKKQCCAAFAEMEAGLLYIRSRELQISGGALGTITLYSKGESKFSPALGAGLRVRVWPHWAVLCYVKNHFMTWDERRIESAPPKRVWKSYWQLGVGLSYSF